MWEGQVVAEGPFDIMQKSTTTKLDPPSRLCTRTKVIPFTVHLFPRYNMYVYVDEIMGNTKL